MTCVEQTRLGVDARLSLQLRHRERAMHEDERGDDEGDQPRVALPEGVDRNAEGREDEVGRKMLQLEEAGLAQRMSAGKMEHDGEQGVVDRDEGETAHEPSEGDTERVVSDR